MPTTNRTGYSKGREGGNMRKTGKGIAISLSLAAFVIAGMLAVGGTAYGNTRFSGYIQHVRTALPERRWTDCATCHIASALRI